MPSEIKDLFCLEKINLSGNKLTSISELKNLHNLEEINASNNMISNVGEDILFLDVLETLILDGNPIT